jgi:predicted metal-binding membrane protein
MSMSGPSRSGAAAFLAMWVVMVAMMLPMMLPSAIPMLGRYRRSVAGTTRTRLGWLTTLASAGYVLVWAALGTLAFPLGAAAEHAAPAVIGLVVLLAGALQLTAWKARTLARCRETPAREATAREATLPADTGAAWRHGVQLGLRCARSCANLMAVPVVLGVMDLRAMAVVTVAITAERLSPAGERVARGTGALLIGGALLWIARSARLG